MKLHQTSCHPAIIPTICRPFWAIIPRILRLRMNHPGTHTQACMIVFQRFASEVFVFFVIWERSLKSLKLNMSLHTSPLILVQYMSNWFRTCFDEQTMRNRDRVTKCLQNLMKLKIPRHSASGKIFEVIGPPPQGMQKYLQNHRKSKDSEAEAPRVYFSQWSGGGHPWKN